MRVIVYCILIFSFLTTSNAIALSCRFPDGIELSDYYDVIFKGRAISAKEINLDATNEADLIDTPNNVTTFSVERHYKGNISDEVNIFHSSRTKDWGTVFEIGEYMLIFAKYDSNSNQIRLGVCDPTFKVNRVPQHITDILIELTKQKELNLK